ncbi:MAG: deoxyribose-phosphate aldolase [Chloroflexi bacterium]|nr:deoxyribose-phosphate aldolase [Chloroflexota bacterium]
MALSNQVIQHLIAQTLYSLHEQGGDLHATWEVYTPAARELEDLPPQQLASYIDHTLLRPEATETDIRRVCEEALRYHFASVCVNPTWISLAHDLVADAGIVPCTVIGFPLGATLPSVKAFETKASLEAGAREVDMVMNIGRLKSGHYTYVVDDITGVVHEAHEMGALVKVILETALLTDEEKVAACVLAKVAGADYVKTSTGFGPGGATPEDVALMRKVVGPDMGVKAAGGIRTREQALTMIRAGATRLGTSSGVRIVSE